MGHVLIKRWLFLALFLAATFIIWLRTSLLFSFFLSVLIMCLALAGWAWVFIVSQLTSFTLVRNAPAKVTRHDTIEIETALVNRSIFPLFNIVIQDYLPCADTQERTPRVLVDFVNPHAEVSLRYGCRCEKRGRFQLGPYIVYFFDPFGLFYFRKVVFAYSELFVYPTTFPIAKFPPLARGTLPWFGVDMTQTSGEEDEFYGIRDYRAGDPVKKIHWFSSARHQSLLIKQYQQQLFFRATIMFNLDRDKNFGQGEETVCEYMINLAASIARHLVERDVSVELIMNAQEMVRLAFNKGTEHLENILRVLAVAEPESRMTLGEILEDVGQAIANNSTLIVLMLDKDWEYFPTILPLAKRNICVVPIIFISSTFVYAYEKRAVIDDVRIKIAQAGNLNPILVSRGDNLAETFLKL